MSNKFKQALAQLFDNNSDCYADTWEDNHDTIPPIKVEGPVIPAMTKEKFIEVVEAFIEESKDDGPSKEHNSASVASHSCAVGNSIRQMIYECLPDDMNNVEAKALAGRIAEKLGPFKQKIADQFFETISNQEMNLAHAIDLIKQLETKIQKMENKLTFTRSELVRFGIYLLSEERRVLYAKTEIEGFSLEERLSQVNHADVENFICLLNEEEYSPQKTPKPSGDFPVA